MDDAPADPCRGRRVVHADRVRARLARQAARAGAPRRERRSARSSAGSREGPGAACIARRRCRGASSRRRGFPTDPRREARARTPRRRSPGRPAARSRSRRPGRAAAGAVAEHHRRPASGRDRVEQLKFENVVEGMPLDRAPRAPAVATRRVEGDRREARRRRRMALRHVPVARPAPDAGDRSAGRKAARPSVEPKRPRAGHAGDDRLRPVEACMPRPAAGIHRDREAAHAMPTGAIGGSRASPGRLRIMSASSRWIAATPGSPNRLSISPGSEARS